MSDWVWKTLLLIQPLVGSSLSGLLGRSLAKTPINYTERSAWYKNLKQSPLTPPPFVFGIVWPILYILLGVNAYIIYNKLKRLNRPAIFEKVFLKDYLVAYESQLLLNFSWSFFFFSLNKPVVSLIIVALMVIFTVYLLVKSWGIDKSAFYALLPYFLWISFATYLNFYIVKNN